MTLLVISRWLTFDSMVFMIVILMYPCLTVYPRDYPIDFHSQSAHHPFHATAALPHASACEYERTYYYSSQTSN